MDELLDVESEGDDDWYELALRQAHLVFVSAGQDFVVPLCNVDGVRANCSLVTIPDMPSWVCGALSHQGRILPVIDLRERLGGSALEQGQRQVLVLVQDEEEKGALLVDAVDGTIDIQPEQVTPSGGNAKSCVLGLAQPESGSVKLVIDLRQLLSPCAGTGR